MTTAESPGTATAHSDTIAAAAATTAKTIVSLDTHTDNAPGRYVAPLKKSGKKKKKKNKTKSKRAGGLDGIDSGGRVGGDGSGGSRCDSRVAIGKAAVHAKLSPTKAQSTVTERSISCQQVSKQRATPQPIVVVDEGDGEHFSGVTLLDATPTEVDETRAEKRNANAAAATAVEVEDFEEGAKVIDTTEIVVPSREVSGSFTDATTVNTADADSVDSDLPVVPLHAGTVTPPIECALNVTPIKSTCASISNSYTDSASRKTGESSKTEAPAHDELPGSRMSVPYHRTFDRSNGSIGGWLAYYRSNGRGDGRIRTETTTTVDSAFQRLLIGSSGRRDSDRSSGADNDGGDSMNRALDYQRAWRRRHKQACEVETRKDPKNRRSDAKNLSSTMSEGRYNIGQHGFNDGVFTYVRSRSISSIFSSISGFDVNGRSRSMEGPRTMTKRESDDEILMKERRRAKSNDIDRQAQLRRISRSQIITGHMESSEAARMPGASAGGVSRAARDGNSWHRIWVTETGDDNSNEKGRMTASSLREDTTGRDCQALRRDGGKNRSYCRTDVDHSPRKQSSTLDEKSPGSDSTRPDRKDSRSTEIHRYRPCDESKECTISPNRSVRKHANRFGTPSKTRTRDGDKLESNVSTTAAGGKYIHPHVAKASLPPSSSPSKLIGHSGRSPQERQLSDRCTVLMTPPACRAGRGARPSDIADIDKPRVLSRMASIGGMVRSKAIGGRDKSDGKAREQKLEQQQQQQQQQGPSAESKRRDAGLKIEGTLERDKREGNNHHHEHNLEAHRESDEEQVDNEESALLPKSVHPSRSEPTTSSSVIATGPAAKDDSQRTPILQFQDETAAATAAAATTTTTTTLTTTAPAVAVDSGIGEEDKAPVFSAFCATARQNAAVHEVNDPVVVVVVETHGRQAKNAKVRLENCGHGGGGSGNDDTGIFPTVSSPPRPWRLGGDDEQKNVESSPHHAPTPPSIWSAVRKGDVGGVKESLEAGATIDEGDEEGRTPLMVACAAGDLRMADLLLNDACPPASVAARTIEDWTPLMIACGGGMLDIVKILVEAGAQMSDRDSTFGSNTLMWACGGGHAEVVRFLLDHGASQLLQSMNEEMWTPLMIACDAGSLETVRILVEAGADVGAYNKEGMTALDIAIASKHRVLQCYLTGEGARSSKEFWAAADTGDDATVLHLLKRNGHLVGVVDKDGRTALLLACIGVHVDLAKVLVEAGADVDFQDPSGSSPLSIAVVLGYMHLAKYIVQVGGAKLSLTNDAGWTPLMQAVAKGDIPMARYLVDRGAGVNDGTPDGGSVLDLAKKFKKTEMERYLEAKGGFSSYDVEKKIEEANDGKRGVFRLW